MRPWRLMAVRFSHAERETARRGSVIATAEQSAPAVLPTVEYSSRTADASRDAGCRPQCSAVGAKHEACQGGDETSLRQPRRGHNVHCNSSRAGSIRRRAWWRHRNRRVVQRYWANEECKWRLTGSIGLHVDARDAREGPIGLAHEQYQQLKPSMSTISPTPFLQ